MEAPFSICEMDFDGSKFRFVNPRFAQVLGYSEKELLTISPIVLLTSESKKKFQETIKAISSTKKTYFSEEFETKAKNGQSVWGLVRAKVNSKEGKPNSILLFVQEITERKKAEEALRESEQRLKSILDSMDDGIVLIGLDGKVTDCNEAALKQLGFTRKEVVDKNITDFIFPEDKQSSIIEASYRVRETGKTLVEARILRKNKSVFPAEISITAFYDENKKPVALLGVARDITERREMESKLKEYTNNLEKLVEERTKQLKERERLAAIGATAGMVGHDIRNPLQAIISNIYLLRSDLSVMPEGKMKDSVKENFDDIENNILYVNKIVADLQDYAKPLKPEYANVDLSEVATNVVKDAHVPDNIKVDISSNTFQKIKTEPTFIRRILTNLVCNAIQAMPNGGNLELTSMAKEDKVIVTVADTGEGIPEDFKPKLFSPMLTTKAKGQGLGLAVVKRLVEALSGKVSFESEEGKGTKFIIELPIIQ
jgi:PAS domain S-box-containing protein